MATIRVNQFTDGPTGHVNLTFICSIGTFTFGANVSPSSGAQEESVMTAQRISSHPNNYSYTDLSVSDAACLNALAFAQAASQSNTAYSAFCNNCVDFADRALTFAGFGTFSIADYLTDGTMTDVYAKVAKYICTANKDDWMYSTNVFLDPLDVYIANYYRNVIGYEPDMSFTGTWFELHDYLRSQFGPASWDDYIDSFEQEWYDNGGSPIAIDLDGNGLGTIGLNQSNVFFDIAGDGTKRRTGWLNGADAFLSLDADRNGRIDGVAELFGGLNRGEGYAKLSLLDSNYDDVLDARDEQFSALRLWRDENMDGETQEGELLSLEDFKILSFDLNYRTVQIHDKGNLIGEVSSASTGGGASLFMGDIYFQYDKDIPLSAAPDLASGSVVDAVRAAALLAQTVSQFGVQSAATTVSGMVSLGDANSASLDASPLADPRPMDSLLVMS